MSNPKKAIGELIIHPEDYEIASMIIARLMAIANPELDEYEASEMLEEFLLQENMNLDNIMAWGVMIRAQCIFNPDLDTVH